MPYKKLYSRIKVCKDFLERELRKEKADYKCNIFRAANWSMMPTKNITRALIANGIEVDTSVFKYGKRSNRVVFNYENVYDKLIPWFINENSVCIKDNNGKLLEIPIYCENRKFWYFITLIRIFRMVRARFHQHEKLEPINKQHIEKTKSTKKNIPLFRELFRPLSKKHAWKLDFNQATGIQLIRAVERIRKEYNHLNFDIPIVLIGHSKSFIKHNEKTLKLFLKFISSNPDKFSFALFNELDFSVYRR